MAIGAFHIQKLIIILESCGDFAVGVDGGEFSQGSSLNDAFLADEEEIIGLGIIIASQDGDDSFVFVEVQEIDNGEPFASPAGVGNLVTAHPIDFADRGEEEDVGMGLDVLHQFDRIARSGLDADDAAPATMLGGEGIVVHPLEITIVGQKDQDVLLRDEVFVIDVRSFVGDFGEAFVAKAALDLQEFFDEEGDNVVAGRKQAVVFSDVGFQSFFFGIEFILLHALQSAEGHRQDRVGLRFA